MGYVTKRHYKVVLLAGEELLEVKISFTTEERNLQRLDIEMFKVNNVLSLQLVSESFHFAEIHYNFRHNSKTSLRLIILILKNMASNLYHILDPKSGIS